MVQCGPTDNPAYYITKITSGTIPPYSTEPGKEAGEEQDKKWTSFGAQFESVATGMLISKKANIGGWYIGDNKLGSQNEKIFLEGNTEQIILSDQISLDNEGLKLCKDTNRNKSDIKAQIHIKNIETVDNIGVSADKLYPEFKQVVIPKITIIGIQSGDKTDYNYTIYNIWEKDQYKMPMNSTSTFKNLTYKFDILFNNPNGIDRGGFVGSAVSMRPIINGTIGGKVHYEPPSGI